MKVPLTLIHYLQFGRGAVLKSFPQIQHFDDTQDAELSGGTDLPQSVSLQNQTEETTVTHWR